MLHVDLDPFFVSVERSLDPSLRGRAMVIGGDGSGMGFVAAASEEARAAGVRVGMALLQARHLCPDAAFQRGDLDTYGRVGEEVTAVLLAASRRVERPSADEAFVDLSPEPGSVPPVRATETIRDELQRRLGLDASLGLATSRLAARIASGWAKPRGLLVVLPGYERSFVATKPISLLELPPHLESALERAGFETLGKLAEADDDALGAAVGAAAAEHVRALARGEGEPEIAVAAPPAFLQEEATVRDRKSDPLALAEIAESLARRAARRLGRSARRRRDRRRGSRANDGRAARDQLHGRNRRRAHRRGRARLTAVRRAGDAVRGLLVRLAPRPESSQASLFTATPAFRRAVRSRAGRIPVPRAPLPADPGVRRRILDTLEQAHPGTLRSLPQRLRAVRGHDPVGAVHGRRVSMVRPGSSRYPDALPRPGAPAGSRRSSARPASSAPSPGA